LELTKSTWVSPLLSLDVGVVNAGDTVMTNGIGKPLLRLGRKFYSAVAGDYYGIGFGYAPFETSKSCCEIGTIITTMTGNTIGDLVFSTRPTNTDVVATERMRIKCDGNVGIRTNPHATYKVDVNGTLNVTSILVGGSVISGSKWTTSGTNIYYTTGNVGIGTTNPRAILDLATPDIVITTSLLDFRNIYDYGIYATSTSIGDTGNTLDFFVRDYNGGANTIRNVLSLRPDGNVGSQRVEQVHSC
jgi:hypothetical protein